MPWDSALSAVDGRPPFGLSEEEPYRMRYALECEAMSVLATGWLPLESEMNMGLANLGEEACSTSV